MKILIVAAIAAASAFLIKRYNDPEVVAMRTDPGVRRDR